MELFPDGPGFLYLSPCAAQLEAPVVSYPLTKESVEI